MQISLKFKTVKRMKNIKTLNSFKFLLKALIAVLLCVSLAACGSGYVFDGEKIATDDVFRLDYKLFNGKENSVLVLKSGSTVKVAVFQEEGSVDITVGIDGENPIYEGHGLVDITFTLNVDQSGTYRITVTGHNAKGSITFVNGAVA